MKLTERQKKFLRREAHNLKPILVTGDKGVTDAFLQELHSTLEHHELIKIKVRAADRDERDAAIADLTKKMQALLVSRVGNNAVLYRAKRKNPRIKLPPPG
jgi:RNA-binding protein